MSSESESNSPVLQAANVVSCFWVFRKLERLDNIQHQFESLTLEMLTNMKQVPKRGPIDLIKHRIIARIGPSIGFTLPLEGYGDFGWACFYVAGLPMRGPTRPVVAIFSRLVQRIYFGISTMPLKQDRLKRSLKIAQNALAVYERKLDEKKIDAAKRKKDPRWRKLVASCKKIESRLESLAQLIARGEKPAEPSEEQ